MLCNHIPKGSHWSGYIRWFKICLIVYAIACTIMCVYFIANCSFVENDYSTTDTTFKKIERRVRDLPVIHQQIDGVKVACRPVPRDELRKKLGPAFIPRYMSEDEPEVNTTNVIIEESNMGLMQNDQNLHEETTNKNKIHRHRHNHQYEKKAKELEDFEQKEPVESKLLDTDFEQKEPAEPNVENGFKSERISETFIKTVIPDHKRPKRTSDDWICKSENGWLDLGPDYFPRFLRSVLCTQKQCFGSADGTGFHCRSKAFTVKVLRRIKDTCVENPMSEKSHKLYENGMVPRELRELWLFEEKAVTFCCECALL